MAVNKTKRSGHRTALALAVAALALPGVAFAEPEGGRHGWGRGEDRAQPDNGQAQARSQGGNAWGSRSDQARSGGGGQTPAWGARNDESRGNGGQAPAWDRGRSSTDSGVQTRGWSGRSGGAWSAPTPSAAPPVPATQPSTRWSGDQSGSRDRERGEEVRREHDRRDADRRSGSWSNSTTRTTPGSTWWGRMTNNDRDRSRESSWRDNDNRWRDNDRHGDYRNWDRRWRDNSRYDWYRYRSYNPSIYRWGNYYSPYRNYSYRRLSIGFTLQSLFYGSRYWINDPWQYRLPEVYGPYRWIRYYDDALLVNIYDGEVVDVIYDFFW